MIIYGFMSWPFCELFLLIHAGCKWMETVDWRLKMESVAKS